MIVMATLAIVGWSLPWWDWPARGTLGTLPNQHTQYELVFFQHYVVTGILAYLPLVAYLASALLILLALARVIERLGAIPQADGPASPANLLARLQSRLVSAWALRAAAVSIVLVWILFGLTPGLGLLWMASEDLGKWVDATEYSLILLRMLTLPALLTSPFVLALFALAAIQDRLDRLEGKGQ